MSKIESGQVPPHTNPTRALANIASALWRDAEKECDQLRARLKESNGILNDLLAEDYLPDHYRTAIAVQFEYNRAALAKDERPRT